MTTLPLEIPKACHLNSHLTSHWGSLSQLHLMHQVTLPVDTLPRFLSHTQSKFSRKSSTRFKWPLTSSLPALLMNLQPYYSNWSHWRCFYKMPIPPILLKYLIPMSILWHLMHNYYITTHLTFHHRSLHQLQLLPKGTLTVTYPQPCHLHLLQTSHLRSLSQIHHLIPVNIKVLIPQALQPHPQVCHLSNPHKSHLIKLALILHHPQVWFFMQLQEWHLELHHKIHLVHWQTYSLLNYPVDHPLQALHPQGCHKYHPKRIHLIKNDPATSLPPSLLLTSTTATAFKNLTEYPSMVQNSIIATETVHPHQTYTGSLLSYITSSCTSTTTYVYPLGRPTRVLPTYPLITPSLIPSADTKYVISPTPTSPTTPDLIHVFQTFLFSLTLGPV